METIKLLLAHADRRINNLIEVAVLDVCYERATVQSTRISRVDEFVHQGNLRDFDLIVVGADQLFQDRRQQAWAAVEDVVKGIEAIRSQHSTPLVALTASQEAGQVLLDAGADVVLPLPLVLEQLKPELRSLLDLNGFVEETETGRWSAIGSLLRGFQRSKISG